MTTKYLKGYYPGGYALSERYSKLVIEPTAQVRGDGVVAAYFATVVNNGSVYGSDRGVYLEVGGSVANGSATNTGASITGYDIGVRTLGAATVANFGKIGASGYFGDGVVLGDGGILRNGSAYDTTALISGYFGVAIDAAATIVNDGTIDAAGYAGNGVLMVAGGTVTNGSNGDTTALIRGAIGVGVDSDTATIVNLGTIDATWNYGGGVFFGAGGSITNGSADDTTALIRGAIGVRIEAAPGSIANFGTIDATGSYGAAVLLGSGGSITNGSAHDATALIYGYSGVRVDGARATVVNLGTIEAGGGAGNAGVLLMDNGLLTNGSATNAAALISGYDGVDVAGVTATIVNFGTIRGTQYGVMSFDGVNVTNGSAGDTQALIMGIDVTGVSGAVTNFGTIVNPAVRGAGIYIIAGGAVTNGSADDTTAFISGDLYGVTCGPTLTLANFGTIKASQTIGVGVIGGEGRITNGTAFDTTALISGYNGCDVGGHATLINNGTILGAADGVDIATYGAALVNGSVQNTAALVTGRVGLAFSAQDPGRMVNFGTIQGADWRVRLEAHATLTNGSAMDRKALIVGAAGFYAHENFGYVTLDNFGTVEGTSGLAVAMGGSGSEVIAEAGSAFIGAVFGAGGRLDLAGGGTGTITGLGANGTLTGAVDAIFSEFGSYAIGVGGDWALSGSNVLNAGANLVDQGTLINRGALTVSGTVSINKTGVLRLGFGNVVGGQGGDGKIVDQGLLIKGPGVGTITVAVQTFDNGVLEASSGTLEFSAGLLGSGILRIDAGATLRADGLVASGLTAMFNGAAATLALSDAREFHATIDGFAQDDAIDLLKTVATGASVNAGDQLVIVSGARTLATLQLSGNYVGATFATKSDGDGGTDIELVSVPDAGLPNVQRMVSAMAAMAPAAGVMSRERQIQIDPRLTLVSPHVGLQ